MVPPIAAAKVNVKDPKYQVSPNFPPDKESTWHYPAHEDGWVLAHNAIRYELANFREALEALVKRNETLDQWHVDALQKAISGHLEHVHGHHHIEDDLFGPFLKDRIHYPEKLETDHVGLVEKMKAVEEAFGKLKVGDSVKDFCQLWTEYETLMLPHLKEEEEIGLPLSRAFFSHDDYQKIVPEIIKQTTKFEMGSFIYVNGEEFFRSSFMKNQGIPFFVWYIDFKFSMQQFERQFEIPIKAVKAGAPPAPEPSFFQSILKLFGLA